MQYFVPTPNEFLTLCYGYDDIIVPQWVGHLDLRAAVFVSMASRRADCNVTYDCSAHCGRRRLHNIAPSTKQLHVTRRKIFYRYRFIVKEFLCPVFLQIFFLYPAGNFVVLRGTYFEQMAHWLARERNYYCCIQEVKFDYFWLLSAEPTEIVVEKDVLVIQYWC